MAQIQDKYESISDFERKLMGWKVLHDEEGSPVYEDDGITLKKEQTDPSISTILDALYLMIQEGQLVEKLQGAAEGSRTEPVTMDELKLAMFTSVDFITLSVILHTVFMRCFTVKKNQGEQKEQKTKESQSRPSRKKNTTT
jgi:hypothetical protein